MKKEGRRKTASGSFLIHPSSFRLHPSLRWLIQLGLPLAAGAGLVVGVLLIASLARDDLTRRGEYVISFTDVQCDPPPGLSREEFLEEAQYLAGLPDRFDVLAEDTTARLQEALAAHPWVARVRRVQRTPDGGVRAELEYREPVLWVPEPGRAVDGEGMLLPVSARRQGLPVLAGKVTPPAGRPGQPWGDPGVLAAARVIALLRPHADALSLDGASVEFRDGSVTLRTMRARIVWGSPPGEEAPGEANAEAKVNRLLAASGAEIDLR
jgi:hypothetical protein